VLDALLDAEADIEAPGGVIAGGTPLTDPRAFGQWRAAHRLVERGARRPAPGDVNRAFWGACHSGQRRCAEYLLAQGADLDWVPPWEPLTPLDAATRSAAELGGPGPGAR
jgi:hypothetical protein